MYNILIDKLPTKVKISNEEFQINSDFRTGILFEQMIFDVDIKDDERTELALELYFDNDFNASKTIKNIQDAIEKILWFYKCGKEDDIGSTYKNTKQGKSKIIYDYDVDQEFIYSAFLKNYNIDLQDIDYMHWWKFRANFKALDNCMFSKILEYRSVDLTKIKDKERKQFYKEMQELYKIKTKIAKEEQERINAICEALEKGLDITNLL